MSHKFAPGSTPLPRHQLREERPAEPYVDTQDPNDPESEAYEPDTGYDGGVSAAREAREAED